MLNKGTSLRFSLRSLLVVVFVLALVSLWTSKFLLQEKLLKDGTVIFHLTSWPDSTVIVKKTTEESTILIEIALLKKQVIVDRADFAIEPNVTPPRIVVDESRSDENIVSVHLGQSMSVDIDMNKNKVPSTFNRFNTAKDESK